MESKSDKSDQKFLPENFPSSGVQKEDRKPLSYKLKYITAAVIFYGNIAFVRLQLKLNLKYLKQ